MPPLQKNINKQHMYISLPFSLLHSCLINQWKLDKDKNTLHSVLVQEKKEKKTPVSVSVWVVKQVNKKSKNKKCHECYTPPLPNNSMDYIMISALSVYSLYSIKI